MDRGKQVFSSIRGQVSGWIITGSIIAFTGFTPQEWTARVVRLFPTIEANWLPALDLRLVLVGLGTAIVVGSVLLQNRASRRLATVEGLGSITAPTAGRGAPAAAEETADRVDHAELRAELRAEHTTPSTARRSPLSDKPSIAVLPFQNMSDDKGQDYFCDGLVEDIITTLSKLAGLQVIARNSTFTYKGTAVDLRRVGRELGVRYVLEGSVRKSGNRVRVTGQLVDAESGAHIWADRFDRDLTDIFTVQDELTQEIIAALKIKLSAVEKALIADSGTKNLDAHDLVMRGRELLTGPRKDREMFTEATAFLRRAIELDPDYSAPYAGLGMAYLLDYQNHWSDSPGTSLETAGRFARESIVKDDRNPFAHYVAAQVYMWQREYDQSLHEADRALSLSPNYALALNVLGGVHLYSGEPAKAIPYLEQAIRLDPAQQHHRHFLGTAYFVMGNYETAAAIFKDRIAMTPTTDFSRAFLASALGHLGRLDEARQIWRELMEINPRYSYVDHLARLPFRTSAEADRIADGLRKAGLVE
jgi:adenylate cyclase